MVFQGDGHYWSRLKALFQNKASITDRITALTRATNLGLGAERLRDPLQALTDFVFEVTHCRYSSFTRDGHCRRCAACRARRC